MPICNNPKYTGKAVVLEYAIACGDVLPANDDFVRIGAMRTKEFNIEWETTDATADDSIGSLRENLSTFQTLTMSGDGVHKVFGTGAEDLKILNKHVLNPVATGGQPVAWLRMTFPDLTFTAFMNITNFSRSAPYDDVVTYSFEAGATASDFGLIVEDTPVPTTEVTAVTVAPTTVEILVDETEQLVPSVAPSSSNQSVQYSTAAPGIATVSNSGLVRGIAAGTTNVTVTSVADSTKFATVAVTVS